MIWAKLESYMDFFFFSEEKIQYPYDVNLLI